MLILDSVVNFKCMKKQVLFILFSVIFASSLLAQDKSKSDAKFSLSTTITNKHLWRSLPSGKAPCIEPSADFSMKGFTLGVWSCYAIDNSYKELDFYLTYKWKFLELGVYDYYCPVTNTKVEFGNFEHGQTEHMYEAQSIVRLFSSNLKLMAAVAFGGADWDKTVHPVLGTIEYEQRYSTYFEVAYSFHFGSIDITPEVGLTPANSMYAKEFSVFNYGVGLTKDIKINDKFKLPTSYKIAYNNTLKIINFSFGLKI